MDNELTGIPLIDFLERQLRALGNWRGLGANDMQFVARAIVDNMRREWLQINESTGVNYDKMRDNPALFVFPLSYGNPRFYNPAGGEIKTFPTRLTTQALVPGDPYVAYSHHNRPGLKARLWRIVGEVFSKPKWIARGVIVKRGRRPVNELRTYPIQNIVMRIYDSELYIRGFYEPITDTFYFTGIRRQDVEFY